MVRHSSKDELKPASAAIRSLRSQGVRPDGYGYDYRKFGCFPGGPPLAKFLRRYVTLREALMRLRAESPNRKEQKPFFRAVCDATLALSEGGRQPLGLVRRRFSHERISRRWSVAVDL